MKSKPNTCMVKSGHEQVPMKSNEIQISPMKSNKSLTDSGNLNSKSGEVFVII
jgi:hypothetical protein